MAVCLCLIAEILRVVLKSLIIAMATAVYHVTTSHGQVNYKSRHWSN